MLVVAGWCAWLIDYPYFSFLQVLIVFWFYVVGQVLHTLEVWDTMAGTMPQKVRQSG